MNDNNLSQFVQQSFRIAIGAMTSLAETVQNPEKRTEAISEMQMEFSQKAREWAVKGENTETEARRVLDNFLQERNFNSGDRENYTNNSAPNTSNNVYSGLRELTNDIVALREELSQDK